MREPALDPAGMELNIEIKGQVEGSGIPGSWLMKDEILTRPADRRCFCTSMSYAYLHHSSLHTCAQDTDEWGSLSLSLCVTR